MSVTMANKTRIPIAVCYIIVTMVTRCFCAQEVCSYTLTAPKDGDCCPSLGQMLDGDHQDVDVDIAALNDALKTLREEFESLKNNCSCNTNLNPSLDQILADNVIARYPLNGNANDVSGNGHHGNMVGSVAFVSAGISGQTASFNGASKINVDNLRNTNWGSSFSVSVWFKRTGQWGNYQGIVSNGYHTSGSWEIRMGRELEGQMLGGGVVTADDTATWNYVHLVARKNVWHHVVMTYDGVTLNYYLDNVKQEGEADCCHGDMLIKNTPLTIGQAGVGKSNEYFYGLIDEVVIFGKVLSSSDVSTVYNELKPM
ncbi:uncharacterized protein LOC144452901 [Glandiceps talaboti]